MPNQTDAAIAAAPSPWPHSIGSVQPPTRAPRRLPSWAYSLLRVPLAVKLSGASALLVIMVGATLLVMPDETMSRFDMVWLIAAVSSASLLASLGLVHLALRPLRDLETTTARVTAGDLQARVPSSPLADREIARIGTTLNTLLDRLMAERQRIGQLAAQVIEAGDRERSRIAHELHDSTAQTLAALAFLLATELREATGDEQRGRLAVIHSHAVDALEEVRLLSQSVHPRVLDDLGIAAALEWLARRTRERYGIEVAVELPPALDGRRITRPTASVLYHVAQEATANALRHARARHIRIALQLGEGVVRLQVADDGVGFDVSAARSPEPGVGLFAMSERVALANGTLDIDASPGRGTRITAAVPTVRRDSQGG